MIEHLIIVTVVSQHMLLLVRTSPIDWDCLISEKLMMVSISDSTARLNSLELLLLLVPSLLVVIPGCEIDRVGRFDIPQVVDLVTYAGTLLFVSHYMTFTAILLFYIALA